MDRPLLFPVSGGGCVGEDWFGWGSWELYTPKSCTELCLQWETSVGDQWETAMGDCSGRPRMQKFKSPLLRIQSYQGLVLSKPGVGWNTALPASHTSRKSDLLIPAILVHSTSFFTWILFNRVMCDKNSVLNFYSWFNELCSTFMWPPHLTGHYSPKGSQGCLMSAPVWSLSIVVWFHFFLSSLFLFCFVVVPSQNIQ